MKTNIKAIKLLLSCILYALSFYIIWIALTYMATEFFTLTRDLIIISTSMFIIIAFTISRWIQQTIELYDEKNEEQ